MKDRMGVFRMPCEMRFVWEGMAVVLFLLLSAYIFCNNSISCAAGGRP